ncbi:protein serine/threonine phosphatase 2C [Saccharata proteae CBS 121410]|uniref:Protein phosphatase n=1 Tax=Saccharata proteae CBS 121410 TaxID=1314787 RepID=A0A9P4HTE2_9PEZI|nr:protein serine/threonine phosphatase 2C [Saccharata proteae CBS 121410]
MSLAGSPLVFSTKLGALARAGLCSRTQWALCNASSTSQPWLSANIRNRLFHGTSIARSTSPQFAYRISASYSAKGDSLDPERNLYNHDPFVRIKQSAAELKSGKVDKRDRPASGQDAFFVHQVGDTGAVAFGVADGVGGWTDSGVDPADFAHGLCDYMAAAANGYPEGFRKGPLRPKDLLQIGYDEVTSDRSILGGGSTACLANADPKGTLEVANLGDSGFIHLGMNAVRYFSPPQTHAFNTPYQLSKIPPKMLAQMRMFGGSTAHAETPKDADVTQHTVKHGDVLLFATDGVWDNLSPQDVLKSIGRLMTTMGGWVDTKEGFKVSDQLEVLTEKGGIGKSANNTLQALLALAITREAKEASLNYRRDGPFAKEVQKYYPQENWHGGKPDDICVVVAIAVEDGVA